MVSAPGGTLFPTMVMGSLPRPQRIRDLSRTGTRDTSADAVARRRRALGYPDAGVGRVGLPLRWRVASYVLCYGFHRGGGRVRAGPGSEGRRPRFRRPLRSVRPRRRFQHQSKKTHRGRRSGVPEDHKSSSIIVALPSPYTLGWRMWSAEHSTSAFPTREDFMEAIIPIVRREIQKLARLGVDAIQLDNPWPQVVVDPHYRRSSAPPPSSLASTQEGIAEDLDREAALCVKCVNGATEGIEDVFPSVHVCHTRGHTTWASDDVIIGVLGQMKVQRGSCWSSRRRTQASQARSETFQRTSSWGSGLYTPPTGTSNHRWRWPAWWSGPWSSCPRSGSP